MQKSNGPITAIPAPVAAIPERASGERRAGRRAETADYGRPHPQIGGSESGFRGGGPSPEMRYIDIERFMILALSVSIWRRERSR